MKKYLGLLLISAMPFLSFSQLKGIVFGIHNGQRTPIKQAKISFSTDETTTRTDEKGMFEVVLPKELPAKMIVSANGYLTDSIEVTKDDRFTGMEIYLFEVEEIDEVVVAFKRDTKSFSRLNPIQVETLGEGELKKAACCNLSESFETNATVDVNLTDAISGAKKIQMLGLDGVYTQMQMENIPFLTGLESSFGLNTVPGTWVESIQITKGTGSVVNGYESMAGLINVEFRKPQTIQRLFVNGYGNILGRAELNIHGGQVINSKWSTGTFAHVSGMNQEIDRNKDGFRDVPMSKTASFMNRWQYEGKRFESRFGVNAYYDERDGGQLSKTTNRYQANTTNKHIDFFAKTGFLFPNKANRSIGIVYQVKLHDISGYYGKRSYGGQEARAYINAIYDGIIGSKDHSFRVGLSGVGQQLNQYLDTVQVNRSVLTPGVFGEYTYTGNRLVAVLGARYDLQEKYGNQFSPRIHLKYTLDEYTDVRITSGKAWRLPSMIVDNSSLLATSGRWFLPLNVEQEVVWNSGISVIRQGKLWGRSASISADFYNASFVRQFVADRERSVDSIYFSFENKASYTNTFQIETSVMPVKVLTVRLAYKYLQVMAQFNGELKQQVMIPQHRGLINVAYASRNKKWEVDATLSVYGKMRLPDVVLPSGELLMNQKSPEVPNALAQVTRHFKRFDVYLGGENLLNYTQANPIISASDPYSATFNATRIYAPILGTVVYAGFRYEIVRKKEVK